MYLEEQINTELTQLSETEPQAVNKSHRKDVAQGKGMSYPALARRNSSVGEDKASCMTRMSLADLVAARENVLSQYFQTFLEYTQGLPALVKPQLAAVGFEPTPP